MIEFKTESGMYKFFVQQIDYQQRKAVLVGCIPFVDLLDKVKYSFRDETSEDSYQRRIDPKRAKRIASYIQRTIINRKDDLPVFPTSIIIAFSNDDDNSIDIKAGNLFELTELPDSILIVDGQHRFEAMRILYNEYKTCNESLFGDEDDQTVVKNYLNSYLFNCCILLNYDLWEQAQIFATVNFNQKKVNKSLFYDIYGIKAPDEDGESISKQNEIYLSHRLVKFLNESKASPLRNMIKMLGHGKGYVSQAFLVEQFLRLLGPSNIWGKIAEEFKSGGKSNLINIATTETAAYFNAIRKVFSTYWPNGENLPASILYKTTGIGGMTRFLEDLHNQMDEDLQKKLWNDPNDLESYRSLINYFKENLQMIEKDAAVLFGTGEDGLFKGSGSAGSQTQLYKEIRRRWIEAASR